MATVEEHFRVVAGYRTHYLVAGEGRPVVIVHGVGGSLLTYRHNVEELSADHRVYAVDLPGHGLSDIPDADYTAENGGAYLVSFIEEVCGAPAALVGISAGGLMCMLAAADRPELVTRLVLVSSAGFGRDIAWTLRLLTLPLVDRFIIEADLKQTEQALLREVFDPALITPELVQAVYSEWQRPGNRRAFVSSLRRNISLFGLKRWRRHLRRISCIAVPVLVVWGRNDRTIPVKHAYRAAKRIAGARLHVFDRCGHNPPFEHPPEFNRIVREFLGSGAGP